MKLRCVPGEKILTSATLFAIELSCGQNPNEVLAWSDFFGVVTAGLIAIANRKLYITDPNSDCHEPQKKSQQTSESDTQATTTTLQPHLQIQQPARKNAHGKDTSRTDPSHSRQ